MKSDLYVLSAKRTPVGSFGGSLKKLSSVQLGVLSAKAAVEEAGVSGDHFLQSIFGNVCSFSSADGPYLARHIALRAGLPLGVGAYTVNRLCGSGFEAILQAHRWADQEGWVLAGGAESMSQTPLIVRDAREGFKFARPPQMLDSLWEALTDAYIQQPMGITAENLAAEFSISRQDCDEWALKSHQRAARAADAGFTKEEMLALETLTQDEHIRRDSSIEKLQKLGPVFGGVTTAGNASGMNDAAASLVVAGPTYYAKWKMISKRPALAKIVASQVVGCDPAKMGLGPVQAVQKLCDELGWKLSQIDFIEINEAFAAQILAVKKSLHLSDEQLNPHGSGISLGHPLGATGARISTHIAHLLGAGHYRRAIGGACIGGGQGIAVAFEAVND
jgi:acetyl-CoA acetyltransferase family protein